MKKATTVDEQIKILKKRGVIIDMETQKVKDILLDIGYYRLGFYWYPFVEDKKHSFYENTKFSTFIELYYLNVDLRNILLKYLKRVEVNFRTKLIYYVSNHYKDDPIWYTNPKLMENWFLQNLETKLYTKKFISENKPIKKHHAKYRNDKYAPTWKTFEFLTFGSIVTIFNAIKDEKLQQRIASTYELNSLETFKNFISTVKYLRNICAHSGVVYDLNFPKGIKKIPRVKFNNNNNQSLDAGIKTLCFMLKSASVNRENDLKKEVSSLFEKQKGSKLEKIISEKIGYNFN